ncbi:Protein Y69H2.15 [Aphelenchoides avenae]|nr:Protein Y69H2.15 [Aphelenchus avenae]
MRLSKRFSAKGLEIMCAKYIHENVDNKKPMMALCWLNWALKHRFDQSIVDACLPVVARLPLTVLERHRQMMTEKILADMLATKLRTCYNQTVNVFHTIHKSDHFYVDLDKCPRCSRQVEQGKIRVLANPCHKLIGCERCLREFGCEIERKSRGDYQAFYQCEHQLLPFHERTEDCHCQLGLYKASFAAASKLRFDENDSALAEGVVVEPASTATTPLPSKR